MPVFQLTEELWFPPSEMFDEDIVAVGGDLTTERLMLAYASGIFPWYGEENELIWWSPDPRCVLMTDELKVSRSMQNVLNRGIYRCSFDRNFSDVINACRDVKRREDGTWIHKEIIEAYEALHRQGYAHSVEVWNQDQLSGGLYGISLGHLFFGESMFSKESNASKVALIFLVKTLRNAGFQVIDCQVYNDHLGSLGAITIPRKSFLDVLKRELQHSTIRGDWNVLMKPFF